MVVRLLNGRGQLGDKLNEKFKNNYISEEVAVYHTWKVPWLSDEAEFEETQRNEYLKVVETIKTHVSYITLPNYKGLKRVFTIEGEKIQAKTVAEILKV